MNALVQLRDGVVVCGQLKQAHGCVCVREEGHWGPHVVITEPGTYMLVQTVCWGIEFEIPEAVAAVAMKDKDWTWSE